MKMRNRADSCLSRYINFFGSKEHKAKIRGFKIGEDLLKEAEDAGVQVVLNATVIGLYLDREITVRIGDETIITKGMLLSWRLALQKIWLPLTGGHCRE